MPLGRISCALLAMAIGLGCETPPPPPVNPLASVIGIAVQINGAKATRVHFVRLNDPAASGLLITSNYVSGEYVYLLNPAPGRYGVVAAESHTTYKGPPGGGTWDKNGTWQPPLFGPPSTSTSSTLTVYLPRALVDKTAATVGTGEIAFMGEIVVDQSGDWAAADETQQRYYGLLAPGDREKNSLLKFLDRVFSNGHEAAVERELDRGPAAQQRFLNHSRIELAEAGWDNRLLQPVGAGSSDE